MENDKCWNCKYFDRYYIKGAKYFTKTKLGWCCKNVDNTSVSQSCEKFSRRQRLKKARPLTLYYLNELLTQISQIRTIVEEDTCEQDQTE